MFEIIYNRYNRSGNKGIFCQEYKKLNRQINSLCLPIRYDVICNSSVLVSVG